MRLIYRLSVLILGAVIFLGLAPGVSASPPNQCPEGFPDEPALSQHIEQAEIVVGEFEVEALSEAGEGLFTALFNKCDGQGRPATTGTGEKREKEGQPAFIRTSSPDANSCAGCHAQPRVGGGGDFVANVFVLAQALDPVTTSIAPEFSNERNTLGMFGAGAIEMLAREMTAELHQLRDEAQHTAITSGTIVTVSLETKGVNFGYLTVNSNKTIDTSQVKGVDADLVIKPFHQAGVVRSIREFTVNAYNHHHGMQAEERFDLNPEKGPDYDEDGYAHELTIGDITAATIFQAALETPGRLLPVDETERQAISDGEVLFEQVGCTSCHVPQMRLDSRLFSEPNPLNPAGTFSDTSQSFVFDMTTEGQTPHLEATAGGGAIVRAYTDLKRHNLCDDPDHPEPIRFFCNEQLAQNRADQDGKPGAEFFLTRKLWDVGNSAPYGHRGDLTTITEAILAHGGESRAERDAFVALSVSEQAAIVKFLKTLQVLPEACEKRVVSEDDSCITGISPGVTLASFEATPADDHILIEWESSSEVRNRGFNLWRSTEPEAGTLPADGTSQQLNSELILSQAAGDGQGERYQWQDHNIEEGVTYYYFLECVVSNGMASTIATTPTAIRLGSLGQVPKLSWDGTLLVLLLNMTGYVWYRRRK